MTTTPVRPDAGLAAEIAHLYREATGRELPVRLRMWDGSETASPGGPVVTLSGPAVLRRLLRRPNQLGLANSYIAGEIDVDGDVAEVLRRLLPARRPLRGRRRAAMPMLRAVPLALRLGILDPRPQADLPAPARVTGPAHSRGRDRAVVAHHYDLSNDFYALVLDPSMAYSCAYWTSAASGYGLADAQRDKLTLICDKLALGRGSRLLDLGCGWGSLTLHAARTRGARVTAVTLSEQQHRLVSDRVTATGLRHLVDVRLQHYGDIDDGPYDAVACVEMGEHVGAARYAAFARQLHDLLRPGGRALVQQMSRRGHAPGGGAFIETYIAPDMHMRPVGQTINDLECAGLEVVGVQALREHYARTVLAWLTTLDQQWDAAVHLVGEPTARMWRLYLAGGAIAFEQRRMGVDQILAVRPSLVHGHE